MWIFQPSKLHPNKYVETTWIFRPSKLYQNKYVETTWIFRPLKLHQKKYVETTWIFRPSKLHQKSTWKRRGFFDQRNYIGKVRGNDVKFDEIWSLPYRRNIQVDSTWTTHWV